VANVANELDQRPSDPAERRVAFRESHPVKRRFSAVKRADLLYQNVNLYRSERATH